MAIDWASQSSAGNGLLYWFVCLFVERGGYLLLGKGQGQKAKAQLAVTHTPLGVTTSQSPPRKCQKSSLINTLIVLYLKT